MKASELKRGMIIKEGKDLFVVIEIEHRTPGNLRAIYQSQIKNILTGKILNMRYSPGDAVEKADLDSRKMQFLYKDDMGFHFMDMETYETIGLSEELVADTKNFLKENLEVQVLYYDHKPVTIELPVNVSFKIIESAPGVKGDSSGKTTKPATLETGLVINVPLFIGEGEIVQVDTRTGQYLGRA